MEGLAEVVEAADSLWAITALCLIGIYALLWKYGGEILKTSRENRNEVKNISESIVTNHGSKNLGDAVDRIQQWMMDHIAESKRQNNFQNEQLRDLTIGQMNGATAMQKISEQVDDYIDSNAEVMEFGRMRHEEYLQTKAKEETDGSAE